MLVFVGYLLTQRSLMLSTINEPMRCNKILKLSTKIFNIPIWNVDRVFMLYQVASNSRRRDATFSPIWPRLLFYGFVLRV